MKRSLFLVLAGLLLVGVTPAEEQPPPAKNPGLCTSETMPHVGRRLRSGDRGEAVAALQQALTAAAFYRGDSNGHFGPQLGAAVIAFHKALKLPRTAVWQAGDGYKLCRYEGPQLPGRSQQSDRVEIDLGRQLLYLVKGDWPVAIMPVSTGNGEKYKHESGRTVRALTPTGSFVLRAYYNGWKKSYLGRLYRPWYFQGGYAVHGSGTVPPEPASHGCVRVPLWDSDYLAGALAVGMPLHIWKQ